MNSSSPTPSSSLSQPSFLPHLCNGSAVFALVIVGELIAFALVLSNNPLRDFSWSLLGYVSMTVQWIMLLSALVLCRLSSVFSRLPVVLSGGLAYVTVLLIALAVLSLALWLAYGSINGWALLKNMVLAAIFSGIFLRYLYVQQQLRNQQHAELQSRIQALHARIRPHFLFNAMNAVASLIPVNPVLAEKVVEDLSRLFRVSLQAASLVSLDDEIDVCRRYSEIEQIRLGERLQFEWDCQHSDGSIAVPSLFLQPLIENAIYHGIQRLPDGGTIVVQTRTPTRVKTKASMPMSSYSSGAEETDMLMVSVINPLPLIQDNQTDTLAPLFEHSSSEGSGHSGTQNAGTEHVKKGHIDKEHGRTINSEHHNHMALQNIEHRLRAHYGAAASINVQRLPVDQPRFHHVTVLIPANHLSSMVEKSRYSSTGDTAL